MLSLCRFGFCRMNISRFGAALVATPAAMITAATMTAVLLGIVDTVLFLLCTHEPCNMQKLKKFLKF